MNERTKRLVTNAYVTLAVAYTLYSWHTYTGLYRWLAEVQLRLGGAYFETATAVFTLLPFALPGVLLRRWKPAPTAPPADSPPSLSAILRRRARGALIAGPLVLIISIAIGFAAPRVLQSEPLTELDLRQPPSAPLSRYVTLSAKAQTRWAMHYSETLSGKTTSYIVVPVTSPDWTPEQASTYWVRVQTGRAFQTPDAGIRRYALLDSTEAPFFFSAPFMVSRSGLLGMVRDRVQKTGLRLSNPYYVLEDDRPFDFHMAPGVGVSVGSFGLVICLALALGWSVQARRR